ncbi:MAG: hypothetical protein HZC37_28430 [Burkholderiales bacterium]|nr:hypothetical protein [Burkholderiales bacterium]
MKLPHRLALKLSPLVEAARGEPLVEPFVEIGQFDDDVLVVESSHGSFLFDRLERVVKQGEQQLATFDSIQSVDIAAFPGGRGERSWSITLFRSLFDRITVARTYDDGDASVVAAKIAEVVGCRIVSLMAHR